MVVVLLSLFVFFTRINPELIFFLQMLIILGLVIERMARISAEREMWKIQKNIYEFWLKTSKMEPKVKRELLEKFK